MAPHTSFAFICIPLPDVFSVSTTIFFLKILHVLISEYSCGFFVYNGKNQLLCQTLLLLFISIIQQKVNE